LELGHRAFAVEPHDTPAKRLTKTPKLCWSPARQVVLDRMAGEKHPLYLLAKANADATGTRSERYGDVGGWCAWMSLTDPSYARKAWDLKLSKWLGRKPDPNFPFGQMRFSFLEFLIYFSWIRHALTDAEVAAAMANFNMISDAMTGHLPPKWRTVDFSNLNYTTNEFFPAAITDLLPENPRKGTRLGLAKVIDYNKTVPFGTLDATGTDLHSSMRNAFESYFSFLAGGGWPEEGEYRSNSPILLTMATESVRSLTGKDHFPNWTARYRDLAAMAAVDYAADWAPVQYGDDENPRYVKWPRLMEYLGTLAGMAQNTPEGENLQSLILGLPGYKNLPNRAQDNPAVRMLIFFNPYAPAKATPLPYAHAASGMGILRYKSDDALASIHYSPTHLLNHAQQWVGARWLYRKGEWLLNAPVGYSIGYTAPQQYPEAVNSASSAGMIALNRVTDASLVLDDGRLYSAGHNSGPLYWDKGRAKVPQQFIYDHRTRILFIPPLNAFVTCNTWDCQDPTGQPNFATYYRPPDQARIKQMLAYGLCQNNIHSPVAPTKADYGFMWRTANGQRMHVSVLSPAGYGLRVVDESQLWPGKWTFVDSEKKFHSVLTPPAFPDPGRHFASMITVEQADQATAGMVRSAARDVQGAWVWDPDRKTDFLALFPVTQFFPYQQKPFEVAWKPSSKRTVVCLAGLDPKRIWTASVDGGGTQPLKLHADGYAELVAAGGDGHTLSVSCNGGPAIPVNPKD
jgi:hypothetical protein